MQVVFGFILMFVFSIAQASGFELIGGYSQLGKGPNGTWYQEPFEHEVELRSPSGGIGFRWDENYDGYWRAGYLYLGRARSRAVATASDENYNPNNPPTYCNGRCWDMSHWYGHGTVQGVFVGKVFTQKLGRVKLSSELGGYLYLPTWTMTIPDWKACELCGPQYLQVKHKNIPYLTPYVSLGVENVFFSYYPWIQAQGDKWPGVYKGAAWNVEIRYSF